MKKETTLWLVIALALVAAAVWWQRGREADDLGAIERPLFERLTPAEVTAIDVDHLERGLQLRLERDARGAWYITDPVLYPADLGVVTLLLDGVGQTRALIVPEIERDAAALGFDPPRAIVTFEGRRDGAPVAERVELGRLDLDGQRVNVRKDGRYLRILRTLDTTLKRSLNDFRSRRSLQVDPREVVELNRSGEHQESIETPPVPLRLNAIRDGAEWRALAPREGLLDPLDFAALLLGTVGLEVDRFVDEQALSLADYGLEPPDLRIELRTADGGREALLLGRKGFGGDWYAAREGERTVFQVAPEDVPRLLLPFEELVDRHVVRAAPEDVTAVVLECGERALRVERAERGWRLVPTDLAGAPSAAPARAETGKVEELVSRLAHAEVLELRLEERFPQDAPLGAVYLELADGRRVGGRLGGEVLGASGEPRLVFQRLGDEFVSWVEPWLGELACTPPHALRALDLVDLVETDVVALELRRGGERLEYARSDQGRWTRAGEDEEARALLPALDPLLFLAAREHLPEAEGPLEDPIEVAFRRRDGSTVEFTVGARAGGSVIQIGAARSLARVDALHARLAALFAE